ncbi:MAG: cytochrome c [Flavobacterium sp.]|nr:cytochrome c [Flavobacterium sp.]
MKSIYLFGIAVFSLFESCGTPAAVSSTTAKKSQDDKSKQETVAAAPTKEAKPMVLTPALAEGKDLYENNCAKCHDLFKPTDYSKENWAPILVSMQGKAHLSDMQMASISNYIYAQL